MTHQGAGRDVVFSAAGDGRLVLPVYVLATASAYSWSRQVTALLRGNLPSLLLSRSTGEDESRNPSSALKIASAVELMSLAS